MSIAWFRPASAPAALDDVVARLGATEQVTVITEVRAHDFVWQHARGWYDLCVYELDNTAQHQYMWPYLLRYPGVLALQSSTLHDARRARLVHEARLADYAAEIAFAGGPAHTQPPWHLARGLWPMLRIPVEASLLTAVADLQLAEELGRAHPSARVRRVAPGVDLNGPPRTAVAVDAPVTVAAAEPTRRHVVARAVERARADGARIELGGSAAAGMAGHAASDMADIVVALRWPSHGRPLTSALTAMARGQALVVADTYETATWPTLDPQTWQPRSRRAEAPCCIAIDPRDEEHSLVLALRRLAADAAFRDALGTAARAWWRTGATVDHAIDSWQQVLTEARTLARPTRPSDWPAHLEADGSGLARRILAACGSMPDMWR